LWKHVQMRGTLFVIRMALFHNFALEIGHVFNPRFIYVIGMNTGQLRPFAHSNQ